jgi:diacylglycerol O-acyltransferase
LTGFDAAHPGRQQFAVLFKVHHAAIDGVTGMALFAALHTRQQTEVEAMEANEPPTPSSRSAQLRAVFDDGVDSWSGPWRAGLRVTHGLRPRRSQAARGPSLALPWTVLNRPVSRDRVIVKVSMARADITRVRALVPGATPNDVMLAVVGGGLRQLFSATGELPDRDLVAGVPIVRTRREGAKAGNDFDLLRIPLGIDQAAPQRRLEEIQRASSAGKQARKQGRAELNDAAEIVPGWVLNAALHATPAAARLGVPMPAVSTIVSNISGPRFPLFLGPAELVDVHAHGPIANGLGVFHAITSYRDTFTLTVTSSPSVLPDPHTYAIHLREAFAQLLALANAREIA